MSVVVRAMRREDADAVAQMVEGLARETRPHVKPKLTGKVRIGGIVSRASHPGAKNGALSGGPQMVEISRDGRRVYLTNSLYGAIDSQFYPNGIEGWMVKLDAKPEGGIAFDEKFFVKWPAPHRPHQVRLEGGDCSSDSYCYP